MTSRERAIAFVRDAGGVLAAWFALLVVEHVTVALVHRVQFTAGWEIARGLTHLAPVALACSIPAAVVVVAIGWLGAKREARVLGAMGALAGLAVGLGVSSGRHFASWAVRAPFVLVLGAVAGLAAWLFAKKAPVDKPRALAAAGAIVAVGAWLADGNVLPRLYPAFHLALLGIAMLAGSAIWLAIRAHPVGRIFAHGALAMTALFVVWTPFAARSVAASDNLRRVVLEKSPVLGRAVRIAAAIAPPPPIDDEPDATTLTAAASPTTRSLDWTGRDIVLVTIDALRADHVSSYGYARRTTPEIDALAARGVRFSRAYCPTPHTSYSIASMMTGRYVRPLLAMGAEDDAETWPLHLRRYGYRTAAFYPPAVFFIDEHKFKKRQAEGLGFEYRKEEFAGPELRRAQITRYLAEAPHDKPLFLWLHLFEPHEPYERHEAFPFEGDPTSDAYDSEIAAADALVGDVVRLVEARRPGAVFIVSADHGEELGDHGGRYHGTTVYEEQVRVPLVVAAPGLEPRVVEVPVQTIDLLPTTLAALDVPRPARVRGRDLGPLLVGRGPPNDEGLAFAETDEQTLVARGTDRLVCARKIAACTLYDVATDPRQERPIADRPERVAELRKLTAAIERENGKVEAAGLPEALRRGLQGDRDAAEDVLALFDDSRVDIRRAAARCAFQLRAPEMSPQLRRALARDEDADVRAWSALALVRLGDPLGVSVDGGPGGAAGTLAERLLESEDEAQRRAAALALAERGDLRGERILVAWWDAAFRPDASTPGEIDDAREILAAFVTSSAKSAVPSLVRSLEDVRLRPHVVETLGALGDARAREPLLRAFVEERYVHVRAPAARALVALGERGPDLRRAFARFLGTPEPTVALLGLARDANLLRADEGGVALADPRDRLEVSLRLPGDGPARLLVLGGRGDSASDAGPTGSASGARVASVDGARVTLAPAAGTDEVLVAEVPNVGATAHLVVEGPGIRAAWLVRRADEVPPPPPRPWDAGASSDVIP